MTTRRMFERQKNCVSSASHHRKRNAKQHGLLFSVRSTRHLALGKNTHIYAASRKLARRRKSKNAKTRKSKTELNLISCSSPLKKTDSSQKHGRSRKICNTKHKFSSKGELLLVEGFCRATEKHTKALKSMGAAQKMQMRKKTYSSKASNAKNT